MWPALLGAAAGVAVLLVMRDRLPDDTYITLSYARNLAEHGHWGLIEARTANTATSPLNVWLLAAGIVVTGSPIAALGAVLVGSLAVAGWWADELARAVGASRLLPVGLVAVLATSPLLLSTVGLESYLAAALMVGLLRYGSAGRPVATGLVAGLAVLCRPDLALVAMVVVLAVPAARPQWWRSGLVAVAVALPWHLWAWFALGGFVPDTLLFKAGEVEVWDAGFSFANGPLLYLKLFPVATLLALAPAVAGLLALLGWVDRPHPARPVAVAAGLAAVAHYAVYSLLATAPYAWYYVPSLTGLAVCAGLLLATLPAQRAAAAVTTLLVLASVGFLEQRPNDGLGPIVYNYGTAAQYAAMGAELGRVIGPTEPILDGIEIGTVAFFCRCTILEHFTDPAIARRLIDERTAGAGPLKRALVNLNFAHRPPASIPPTTWQVVFSGDPGYERRWVVSVPGRGTHFLQLSRTSPTPVATY